MIGDLKGEALYRIAWMSSSYDLLTVVPESRRITYGGDSCVSDKMELLSGCYVDGGAENFSIGDTDVGILLMVPRAGASSC